MSLKCSLKGQSLPRRGGPCRLQLGALVNLPKAYTRLTLPNRLKPKQLVRVARFFVRSKICTVPVGVWLWLFPDFDTLHGGSASYELRGLDARSPRKDSMDQKPN